MVVFSTTGELNTGWKERYFRAHNQANNYSIDYYDNESYSKKRGTIRCCGHFVEEFSPEEEEIHGRYGIKIIPSDDKSRVWWLRCYNEDDKSEWMKILMNSCQKSQPPVHSDGEVAAAFEATFKSLRWRYGHRGWLRTSYTECEQLSRLCSDVINRNVRMPSVDIAESVAKAAATKAIQKNIDSAVNSAAAKAWSFALAATSQRSDIEARTRALHDLDVHEKHLEEKAISIMESVFAPFLTKMKPRICIPILRSCEHPVTNAFVTTIHGFHDYMLEQIREGCFQKGNFHENIKLCHRSVEEWWSGPLEDTNQVCWAMYTNDLSDISSYFIVGYSSYNLYSEVLDANRKLMHRALSFFSTVVVQSNYENVENILKLVLYLVIQDAKVYLKSVLHQILIGFLRFLFEGDVVIPCLELIQPLKDYIDELSDPRIAKLIHLSSFTERLLWKILNDEILSIIDTSHADNCAEIDTTVDHVGAVPS